MKTTRIKAIAGLLVCAQAFLDLQHTAAATPSRYLGDSGRTGYTDATVPPNPVLLWTYVEKHPPRHAWKEPNRELQYIDFDYATQVAIGYGLVVFGSSADHKVYALDESTGEERWHFYTEGPVRFAPVIDGQRVYVASDDGYLYCIGLETGELVWKFRGGPSDGKLVGNDQMVSHWPARSGVLIENGMLYFTAGMWSRDGVFIYCLDPQDASVIWKNDTSGFYFTSLPHSSGFAGVAPQGYLALHRDRLYVPTGRGAPACFDAETGKFLFYENGLGYKPHQPGGSRVMAWKKWVIFKRRSQHVEENVRYEERGPAKGAASGLFAIDVETGRPEWSLTDKNVVAAHGNTMILAGQGPVIKVNMFELMEAYSQYWNDGTNLGHDPNIPDVEVDYAWNEEKVATKPAWMSPLPFRKWEADVGRVFFLLRAGNTILAGGRDRVSAIDFDTGRVLWQKRIDGDARGICVADGQFIVSSTTGKLYCFGEGRSDTDRQITHTFVQPSIDSQTKQRARYILETSGVRAGYALMLGAGDGRLLYDLANQSELVIYCLEPDSRKVEIARDMLDRAGLLGVRAAVHQGNFSQLPYNPYVANLIVWGEPLGSPINKVDSDELYRVLRPYGGIAVQVAGDDSETATRLWLTEGGVPSAEVSRSDVGLLVRRGKLEGAGEWTHPYADIGRTGSSEDSLARLPLGMLWWGGPGPARNVSRHWRAPIPLFSNGILYIQGQHDVIAVDAYNGREMWNRHLEHVGRFPPGKRGGNIVADDISVFCIQGRTCLRLDAGTGTTIMKYVFPLDDAHIEAVEQLAANYPKQNTETRIVWEYLGITDKYVIGTLGNEEVLETFGGGPYNDVPQQARYLFVFDKSSGKLVWERQMDRAVSPMAIVADQMRIYYLDRTDERLYQQKARRGAARGFASCLNAVELATGNAVWRKDGMRMGLKALILKDDVIAAYPNPAELDFKEGDSGVAVYSKVNGTMLWEKPELDGVSGGGRGTVIRHTFVVGDTLFLPWAYDLHTGREKLLKHNPFTGVSERYDVFAQNFCGTMCAGQDLVAYRSASVGFQEISKDSGSFWLPEVRPSCWISVIPAGGIVLAPEGYSTCICPYNYKTSVALLTVERYEDWSVYLSGSKHKQAWRQRVQAKKAKQNKKRKPMDRIRPFQDIKTLYVNLNAPGDHMDADGHLWMAFPRPMIREVGQRYMDTYLPVQVEGAQSEFRYNTDYNPVGGTDMPWLFTSGLEGPLKISANLSNQQEHKYTVNLMFAETEPAEPGGRVFDVNIQGRKVLSRFDIAGKAGGPHKACVHKLEGVAASGTMTIELVPVRGKPPRMCSLAITLES